MAPSTHNDREAEWARRARPRLRRDAIVRLALAIADREGLEAVSFPRLAAELDATPTVPVMAATRPATRSRRRCIRATPPR